MFLAAEKNKMGQINHNPVQIGQQELALKMVILQRKLNVKQMNQVFNWACQKIHLDLIFSYLDDKLLRSFLG